MTNPIDKAQLRALAEAATPGPWASQGQDKARSIWTADGWHVVVNASASAKCGREGDYYDCQTASATCRTTLSEANAKYITAVSPDVLRALLDELATQAAQIEACRADAARVSGYFVSISDRPFASEVLVQRSRQMEGPPKWAARLDGECLNKDGAWEWEPMPSSRDDEFLARCRFDTAAEAIAAVHAAMKEKTP